MILAGDRKGAKIIENGDTYESAISDCDFSLCANAN